MRPEVAARMQELLPLPLNPSSVHAAGREAKKYLENSRKIIADAISAWPNEIIFMASGTEANATALRGISGCRVLVSAIEHSSVLTSLSLRERAGVRDSQQTRSERIAPHPNTLPEGEGIIPVTSSGIIDLATLDKMLASGGPALVSVMLANNETGVIQPISEVSALCKKYGALLHCDAVQGLGKIPVDFGALGADMMTLSAHKCGGPLGAAALVVRRELPLVPLLTGGGQELGRRAGTENVAAIAGFARAVELIDFEQMRRLRGWLDMMESQISLSLWERAGVRDSQHTETSNSGIDPHPNPLPEGEGIALGQSAPRLPNTSCIAMPGVSNEVQLMNFDLGGFAVSAGSACSSGRIEGSHVLAAMGVSKDLAGSAIRVSGGWKTTEEDIISFTGVWKAICERLAKREKP